MKAVVFHAPTIMKVDTVPDPVIQEPTDVVIKVTSTAICGSDLHIYNGYFPALEQNVMGHEFMGEVVEVGSAVKNLNIGDRIVVPFPIACGSCFFCDHGYETSCENSNKTNYGPEGGLIEQKGGGIFGFGKLYGSHNGGQAEYVRVPYADVSPRKVPEGMTDEQILFLSDIMPTGYTGVKWAEVQSGETVLVMGCGPVGLMAMKAAKLLGADQIIGIDPELYRREMAQKVAGAITFDYEDSDLAEKVRSMTGGRGADVVVDAVGMEAKRSLAEKAMHLLHLQIGSAKSVKMAMDLIRRGGRLSILGIYGYKVDAFNLAQLFDKNIQIRTGQAWVTHYIDELMQFIQQGKLVTDDIITHRMPLSDAPKAYKLFNDKTDNCVKVVLTP